MGIKLVGFKVGQSRPTTNVTIKDRNFYEGTIFQYDEYVGRKLRGAIEKSDFISIRRID